MSNDFWGLSTGESAVDKADGSFDAGGGNIQPIPPETSVLAAIDEAKWDKDNSGNRFISLRWAVLKPEEYEGRKVYQKLWVLDDEPRAKDPSKKRDKAKLMLSAIDMNAGGKLLAKPVMPTDEAMTLHLTNKPMVAKIMLWEMRDSMTGQMGRGNWVGAVSSKAVGKVSTAEEVAQSKADFEHHMSKSAGAAAASGNNRNLDDEIPFN